MDRKCLIIVLAAFALMLFMQELEAVFLYNRPLPSVDEVGEDKPMLCVPGRTVVRVKKPEPPPTKPSESSEEEEDALRTHMSFAPRPDETCEVCVCAVSGNNEYCSKRPAKNVNECILLSQIRENQEKLLPFDLDAILAYRIRKDLIWHDGEIPYEEHSTCYRAHSYYTANPNVSEATIETDHELLNYANHSVCFFCVCALNGKDIACIPRSPWYCDYFRQLRKPNAIRDRYATMFIQDRPAYFSQISWRLRRKMDEVVTSLIETAGNDISPGSKCIPYVSEYSDCTEENQCSGCTRCSCSAVGDWSCNKVIECPSKGYQPVDDKSLDNTLQILYSEFKPKPKVVEKFQVQEKSDEDVLLAKDEEIEQKILELMSRQKRSIDNNVSENETHNNGTIKFYHTIDELNEDTLKNTNNSGTLSMIKVAVVPKISRRTSLLASPNVSSNPLHIEYSKPQFNHIADDNKIDSTTRVDDNIDELMKPVIEFTNFTQSEKDKELSKIVVNELKKGSEIIGDSNAPIMSNITFTPENDTLTAMAFIAGNLLNKLWSMEKENSDETIEVESLKHQKINDLLDLFKQPLTLRQEAFLKTALEKLSEAIDKKQDPTSGSLCKNLEEAKKLLLDGDENLTRSDPTSLETESPLNKIKTYNSLGINKAKQSNATSEAIEKINNVLTLMKKFEHVNKNLKQIKSVVKPKKEQTADISNEFRKDIKDANALRSKYSSDHENVTDIDKTSVNLFGSVLEKITRLLLPNKIGKKLVNKIRNQNVFGDSTDLKKKFKDSYNIDLTNMSLTTKDKLVLDYLTKLSDNPSLLNLNSNIGNMKSSINVEGDILLNLSEFFKIKSFVDLLRLIDDDKRSFNDRPLNLVSTAKPTTTTAAITFLENIREMSLPTIVTSTTTQRSKIAESTKDRLKKHLKSILDDLLQLQKERGIPAKGDPIKIADALPCIYNILSASQDKEEKVVKPEIKPIDVNPVDKLADAFMMMKKEIISTPSNSRRNIQHSLDLKPESVVVLERVVQNLDQQKMKNNRRSRESKVPKSFDEIKLLMNEMQTSASNAYKNYAIFGEVEPGERLMLLKTLEAETRGYYTVLDQLKASYDNFLNKHYLISEFVDFAMTNMDHMKKVLTSINKNIQKIKVVSTKAPPRTVPDTMPLKSSRIVEKKRLPSSKRDKDRDMKVNRDEILIQLIKNRVNLFIQLKEARDLDASNDPSYNIAKNILSSLSNGNVHLAKELYKVFVSAKSIDTAKKHTETLKNSAPVFLTRPKKAGRREFSTLDKEPLIHFEEPKQGRDMQMAFRDQMVKQLINIKNMRV